MTSKQYGYMVFSPDALPEVEVQRVLQRLFDEYVSEHPGNWTTPQFFFNVPYYNGVLDMFLGYNSAWKATMEEAT